MLKTTLAIAYLLVATSAASAQSAPGKKQVSGDRCAKSVNLRAWCARQSGGWCDSATGRWQFSGNMATHQHCVDSNRGRR